MKTIITAIATFLVCATTPAAASTTAVAKARSDAATANAAAALWGTDLGTVRHDLGGKATIVLPSDWQTLDEVERTQLRTLIDDANGQGRTNPSLLAANSSSVVSERIASAHVSFIKDGFSEIDIDDATADAVAEACRDMTPAGTLLPGGPVCGKTKVAGRTSLLMEYRRPDAAGAHVWKVRVYTVPLTQGQLMISLSSREDAPAAAAAVAAILDSLRIL